MSPPPRAAPPIALVGLMGAGKSAVARALGERLAAPVIDLDLELEAESGCTVAEFFARFGEPAFRAREGDLLARAAGHAAAVVACGGGVVIEPTNRALLRTRFRAVWLVVSPQVAARRIASLDGRPLLGEGALEDRLETLLRERAPLYAEVARVRVAADHGAPLEVADLVLAAIAEPAR